MGVSNHFKLSTIRVPIHIRLLQKRYNHGKILLFLLLLLRGYFFLIGVGITTAYRIKITNLACLNNSSTLPLSISYGGLRWQIKLPLTLLGLCSISSGLVIGCNLRFSVVLCFLDKVIPLIMISVGIMFGFILTNYKDKNFSSILILSPTFQRTRSFSQKAELVKIGDSGFTEDFGGPGILLLLKSFLFLLSPFNFRFVDSIIFEFF